MRGEGGGENNITLGNICWDCRGFMEEQKKKGRKKLEEKEEGRKKKKNLLNIPNQAPTSPHTFQTADH